MADPSLFTAITEMWSLIPEPIKLGGAAVSSGALGWAGKALNDRRQRQRMRKRLYKEMAHDYSQVVRYYLWHFETYAHVHGANSIWRGLASELRTAYYKHASATRDVFESLKESYSIDDWYKEISQLQGSSPPFGELTPNACVLASYLQELNFALHGLDRRLFMKFIPPHKRPLITTALANYLVDPKTAAKWANAQG